MNEWIKHLSVAIYNYYTVAFQQQSPVGTVFKHLAMLSNIRFSKFTIPGRFFNSSSVSVSFKGLYTAEDISVYG